MLSGKVNKKREGCAYMPFVKATKGAYDLNVLRLFPGPFPRTRLRMQEDILTHPQGEKRHGKGL